MAAKYFAVQGCTFSSTPSATVALVTGQADSFVKATVGGIKKSAYRLITVSVTLGDKTGAGTFLGTSTKAKMSGVLNNAFILEGDKITVGVSGTSGSANVEVEIATAGQDKAKVV